MRTIDATLITKTVERLCIEANCNLGTDVCAALKAGIEAEEALGAQVLATLVKNAQIAREEQVALCQDTGVVVVFVEIGQQAAVIGGSLARAINEGVRHGYERGFLRQSVVNCPNERINTRDNTPAVIHYDIVDGDRLKITVMPKGFGSENMSALKMLKPSDGIDGAMNFVLKTVKQGGQNACPPLIVGVGIGGTMEKAALLAKRALLRPVGEPIPDACGRETPSAFWRAMEAALLKRINALGIGPLGLGGKLTAMAVNIETYPTHIAGLPVAVNLCCHSARHAQAEL